MFTKYFQSVWLELVKIATVLQCNTYITSHSICVCFKSY